MAEDKGERTRRRGARPGRRSAGRLCFRWFRPNPQGECCAREDKRIAGDRAESVFDERVRTTGPPPRTSTAPSYYALFKKKKYYALFSIDCADLTMFISCSDRILAVNFVSQKNLDREFDCCQVMQTVRACTFLVSTLCQILVYLGKNK